MNRQQLLNQYDRTREQVNRTKKVLEITKDSILTPEALELLIEIHHRAILDHRKARQILRNHLRY